MIGYNMCRFLDKFPSMLKTAHLGLQRCGHRAQNRAFLPLEALCTALVQQSKQAHPMVTTTAGVVGSFYINVI